MTTMGAHINEFGFFQSDKYPTCPAGKVPLSVSDPTAQDLLWIYAQRRRAVDAGFSDDLETALKSEGYVPPAEQERRRVEAMQQHMDDDPTHCHAAGQDGDCIWRNCPQERDGEPRRSGRDCPLLRTDADDA